MGFAFSDFLAWQAWLPAIVSAFSNGLGIHSLAAPPVSPRKRNTLIGYGVLAALLTIGLGYIGADQHRTGRQQEAAATGERARERGFEAREDQKLDVLRNVLGTPPGISGEQVLDQVIAKFSQPNVISPAQEATLASEISAFKSDLPNPIILGMLPGVYDFNQFISPLQRAFIRNGITVSSVSEIPVSVTERGFEFAMADPEHPPKYAILLRDAFDLVGITNVHFVKLSPTAAIYKFTIFDAG